MGEHIAAGATYSARLDDGISCRIPNDSTAGETHGPISGSVAWASLKETGARLDQ